MRGQHHFYMINRAFMCFVVATASLMASVAAFSSQAHASISSELDQIVTKENVGKKLSPAGDIDDLAYLRRVSVDLIGRIPSSSEISKYMSWPAEQRRGKVVNQLVNDPRFVDRWTTFFADMLRIRSNATGGQQLLAFVHGALEQNMAYDKMVRRMISASGKAGKTPEVGYILGDNADPMELAGATAQTFLGVRIACAQCHDHPFDMWTQEDFYGFAAFFGKTKRVENRFTRSVYTTEGKDQTVQWPPEAPGVKDRKPVKPSFLYDLDRKGMASYVKSFEALRQKEKLAANVEASPDADADDLLASIDKTVKGIPKKQQAFDVEGQAKKDIKKINIDAALYRQSELRHMLAGTITDPYNRYFSWAFTNRVWKELVGRGFVEPVDDIRFDNEPSHPKALNHLANEFVGSGFDIRSLIRNIVLSKTYSRGRLNNVDEATRRAAEAAFVAAPMRRMIAEAMFDSVITAGHLYEEKYPDGVNQRTITQMVRVRIDSGGPVPAGTPVVKGADPKMAMARPQMMVQPSGYNLEQSISVDFKKVLAEAMKQEDAPKVEMMLAKSKEQIEAERLAAMSKSDKPGSRAKYKTTYVDVTMDYNPKFSTSYRMSSPAPRPHFLRVFGQPGREELGDFRSEQPSMRQALMMLNGSLTHEASRVGPFEPLHKLMVGKKANLDLAIKMVYREILTRAPSADEIAFGKEIIGTGKTPIDGMADLRWALFNCNEFRYLP
jgi:hypothetical protein